MDVVLPIPGGPEMIMFGRFPSLAMMLSLDTVSSFPTISASLCGLYCSILNQLLDTKEDPYVFLESLESLESAE